MVIGLYGRGDQDSEEMDSAQGHTPVLIFLQAFHMLALFHGLIIA